MLTERTVVLSTFFHRVRVYVVRLYICTEEVNLIYYHMFNSLDVPLSIGGSCWHVSSSGMRFPPLPRLWSNLFGEAKRTAPWTKRITNATFLR